MEATFKSSESARPAASPLRRTRLSIPIVISGKDVNGHSFRQDSRTIVVTNRGLLIEAVQQLWLGAEIQLENRQLGRTAVGRVVWWPSESSLMRANEVGIYLPEAEEFCGLGGEAPADSAASAPAAPPPVIAETPASAESAGRSLGPDRPPEEQAPAAGEPTANAAPADASPTRVAPPPSDAAEASPSVVEPAEVSVEPAEPFVPLVPEGEIIETVAVEEDGALPLAAEEPADSPPEPPPPPAPPEPAGAAGGAAPESAASLAAELEKRLVESLQQQASSIEGRLHGSRAQAEAMLSKLEELERQTQARLEASAATLERTVLASIEQRVAPLGDRLAESRAEVERMLAELAELEKRAQANVEEAASQAEQKVMAAVEQRLGSAAERLESSRSQVEAMLAQLDELQAAGQAEIARVRATLPEVSGEAVQFALEGMSERLRAEVETVGSHVVSETRERVRQEGQAAIRAFVDSGELEANLQKVLENQGAALFAHLQKQSAHFSERTLAELQQKSDDMVLAASRILGQRAASAQENVRSTIASSQAEFERATEQAMSSASERLAQKQQQWVEEASREVRQVVDELVDSAGSRMRQLAEANLELMNQTLAARQKSFVEETTQALREKIGELLARLQQS